MLRDHPPGRVLTSSSSSSSSTEPVRVFVRIRPSLAAETSAGDCCRLIAEDAPSNASLKDATCKKSGDAAEKLAVQLVNIRQPLESSFLYSQFDRCFGPESTQQNLFTACRQLLLDTALTTGRNATVLAYGVTGAGKTFTMDGNPSTVDDANEGLIPRCVRHVLEQLQDGPEYRWTVKFSHLEVYNEKVFDLCCGMNRQDLPLRQDHDGNIQVVGLSEMEFKTFGDFQKLYQRSRDNRSTAATKLNAQSSRSHSVLRLLISRNHVATGKQRTQKLHLIDLAGSEDNRKTGNVRERMIESGNINRSLFMLSQVIESLNSNATNVPYRNSKLTRLLQDSLGGKAMAIMIACVAPGAQYYLDTMNTLNMATRTRKIVNHTEMNPELDTRRPLAPTLSGGAGGSGTSVLPLKRSATAAVTGPGAQSITSNTVKRAQTSGSVSGVSTARPLAKQPLGAPQREKVAAVSSRPGEPNKHLSNGTHSPPPITDHQNNQQQSSTMDWGNVFSMATPNTKRGLARACLVAAKDQRSKGDLEGALKQYQTAAALQPSSKLTAMMAEIRAEMNGEDVRSPIIRPPEPARKVKKGGRSVAASSLSKIDADSTDAAHESNNENQECGNVSAIGIQPPAKRVKTTGRAALQITDSPDVSVLMTQQPELSENTTNVNSSTAADNTKSLRELEDQAVRRLLAIMNSGDAKIIRSIRGLGEKRAKHIMEYQQAYGNYETVEQLKMAGLGDKMIKNIRNDFLVSALESNGGGSVHGSFAADSRISL